jgi:hypothetical protein
VVYAPKKDWLICCARLKVTTEEQEKMRQIIDKKQETKSAQNSVTVMFHDRKVFLGVSDSFRARGNAAPSLSDALAGDLFVSPAAPSLPLPLNERFPRQRLFRRTRRRTTPHIEKFFAEVPNALSAWFVFGASPNSRSQNAAATITTIMTEQRRCAAA